MVGPKNEVENGKGVRYHAKERLKQGGGSEWYFEERECPLSPTNMLLVRVMVAKVGDDSELATVLRGIPVRQGAKDWNCVSWVKEALEKLEGNSKALGTRVTGWDKVRNGVMLYIQQKMDQHRFDGQASFDMTKIATFDMIEGKETIP